MELQPGSAEPPTPQQLANWRRRMGPPDNEVPGGVAWVALLARSDDIAVAVVGAAVYSTGVRLDIAIRARLGARRRDVMHDMMGALHGAGGEQLLLGVEYADGRTASNVGTFPPTWPPPEVPDGEPSLNIGGGGSGGDGTVDAAFFLCPVPPDGPLTIICAWPARGIVESRTTIDASRLSAALAQVHRLWPPEDFPPLEPEPPESPDFPDDSWFARNP